MTHPAFESIRREHIPSLDVTLEQYRHVATGASHIHLAAADTNNAFLVALPTVPQDSTGVAHVLEHVSLCGSQRYPVRDPFFMMLRRSLNTFMNAFTASDWTAYPFATQNRKDFDNLLDVYLDAVFFPLLDSLDFAQEGHRLEFDKPEDPDSDLTIRGVVYNEMKGAMSSPIAQVDQTLKSHLFPTITYHFNSGGEPEEIPHLGYQQLKDFHSTHYHPSNALFMTFGSFPVGEHHEKFETCVLSRYEHGNHAVSIADERRYRKPVAVESRYSFDEDEGTARRTHVVIGWLLGRSDDVSEMLKAHLLSGVLLDNSASPLRKFLETTKLGSAPSELCGLDDSTREATFHCGLEGTDPEHAEAIESQVMEVLESVARDGVPLEQVQSVLHQVELAQREVGGGRFPYGLQLMMRVLPTYLHGGDPVEALDIDDALEELRRSIEDPGFIKSLVRTMLIDNTHRVRLTMSPDKRLSAQRAESLASELEERKQRLNEADRARIIEQAAALKTRQEQEENAELLPRVGLEDVPDDRVIPEGASQRIGTMPLSWYAQGTNGLVYQQVAVDLPPLAPELVDVLGLFCDCVTEVGAGDEDYLRMQARQAAVSGGVSARISYRSHVDDLGRVRGMFVLAGKALARNERGLSSLLKDILTGARFDEPARLRELIAQFHAEGEASLTQSGHSLAMSAASAGFSPAAMLDHRWDGLEGLHRLKGLDAALDDERTLGDFAARLEQIRDALLDAPRQLLLIGEIGRDEGLRASLSEVWEGASTCAASRDMFAFDWTAERIAQGWSVNTQVNFCAKAYAAVDESHADAPALMVLGPYLTNGYLHRSIREQGGAYGGGASYSASSGVMRFYSYRDPRLAETLADFDRAVAWLVQERHEARKVEEAVLRVLSDIDRPESPAGEAIAAYFGSRHGRNPAHRRAFRRAVMRVGIDDLRRVAERYLEPEIASVAVVSNETTLEANAELGLQLCKL
ncbi:MAG: peptidase M16 [Gammaproteobacteria bacterium]|nr:peptidase M16 [Gammaproteobacteria bacterium]NIP90537.1 peptidase M16 [Gammaproteobacteria bacterium]NIR25180.1 peptidase M16 [Gammaproteobacteria bacterium]NIS06879.1 peptidase M16 [Gammaproteobacteria bacterium]NIU41646.1 peptidase M16 [Gammaproteobacteria bacterium]